MRERQLLRDMFDAAIAAASPVPGHGDSPEPSPAARRAHNRGRRRLPDPANARSI